MKQSKPLLAVLAVVLLGMVCFAYKDHFHNPFQFDDVHTIVSNMYIRDLKNLPKFFKDATTFSSLPANQVYRPGVTTLDAIDYWLGGKAEPDPFSFHISIFISFLVLGIFIYLFALKIYNSAYKNALNPFIALLTTAVYMLHTANAETINYIISRSDSFSTLMMLVSLCTFAYFQKLRKYAIYLIPMLLGLFVKEPTVMVAPLAFLYLYFFEAELGLNQIFNLRSTGKIFLKTLAAFILAGAYYIFSVKMAAATFTTGGYNRWEYLLTQTFVMVHYVNNYFFPFNLSADTDWALITSPFDERVVIGICFILFTLYLAYKASLQARSRPITFGILWFYLTLIPTSSIFPLAEVLNDHRVFLPYVGLTLAVVWALYLLYLKYEDVLFKKPAAKGVLFLLIAAFLVAHMFGVRERCKVWSTGESLWGDVVVKSPHNGRGLMNYGNVLMGKGDYKGALEYFNRAKQEWPYYSYIYTNLGVLYSAIGDPKEAENNFLYARKLNNQNPEFYYFYADFLKHQKRYDEALQMTNIGLALSPQHPSLNYMKNDLLHNPQYAASEQDRIGMAEKLAKDTPTAENWLNLSLIYYNAARYQDCVNAAQEALKLRPDYDLAYNNICSAYNVLHEWDKAIEAGKKAVELSPNNQLAKNNLQASLNGKNGK